VSAAPRAVCCAAALLAADPDLLQEIEQRFPAAKKWFGMVQDLELVRGDDGSLTPRYETLRSKFVLAHDPAGQVVMARLPAYSTGGLAVWLRGSERISARTVEDGVARRPAEVVRGVVVYRGAVAGGDLLYKLTPTHVDEYVYLRSPPPVLERAFTVTLGEGAAALVQAGETLELRDAGGAARLRLSAPVARAADGVRRTGTVRLDGNRIIETIDLRGLSPPILVDPDWSTTGTMTVSHLADAAWRLDTGAVMAVGGCALSACPLGLVREACSQVVPNTSLWTEASGTWTSGPALATGRYSFASVVLEGGELLVAGGCTGSTCSSTTALAERYSKARSAWIPAGSLPSPRARLEAALLPGGDAILPGGCDVGRCLGEVMRYEAAANRWSALAPLPAPRGFATVTSLADGSVLVTGGCADPQCTTVLADALRYVPSLNQWQPAGVMRAPRAGHTATLLRDGSVFVAGGCTAADCRQSTLGTTELWRAGAFTDGPLMRSPRHHHTTTVLATGSLLLAGGTDRVDSAHGTAEIYLPVSNRLVEMPRMAQPRAYHIAVALLSGKVVVGGGCNAATCLPWAEVFDPSGLPDEYRDAGTAPDGGPLPDAGPEPVFDAGSPPPPDLTPFTATGGPHPKLLRTGAAACADDGVQNLQCPVAGWRAQDGDFQPNGHPMRPLANDEVYDAASGLTWQARDDAAPKSQAAAAAACAALDTPGAPAGTWRLPSLPELATLVSYGRALPAIDPAFPDTQSAPYWTSTPVANANTLHWTVRFSAGEVMPMLSTAGVLARCVRGASRLAAPEGRVRLAGPLSAGAVSVRDDANALEWVRDDDGIKRTWRESLDACAHLSLGGHRDWHLPNALELMSLAEYGSAERVKIDPAFEGARPELYWSSTFSQNTPGLAWSVGFNLGVVDAVGVSGRGFARCVRHLQPGGAAACRCGEGGVLLLGLAVLWLRSRSPRRKR